MIDGWACRYYRSCLRGLDHAFALENNGLGRRVLSSERVLGGQGLAGPDPSGFSASEEQIDGIARTKCAAVAVAA